VLGAEHPALAITLNNLAVNARRRGEVGEAEKIYRRAIAILEDRVDPEHPNLALIRRNLERLREEGKKSQGSTV
jgi:Tfp pilus assembly protein PilF